MSTIKMLSGGSQGGKRGFGASGSGSIIPDNVTWKAVNIPINSNWKKCSMSRDGHYQVAGLKGSFLYYSHDYGETWTQVGIITGDWMEICCSSDGHYFYAIANAGATGLYKSSDYGVTWASVLVNGGGWNWHDVACDSSGKYVLVGPDDNFIRVSSDYGVTWSNSMAANFKRWKCAVASDATHTMWVMDHNANVYKSTDLGVTWGGPIVIVAGATLTDRIRCSFNGTYLIVYVGGKMLYNSADGGATWTARGFVMPGGGAVDPGGDVAISSDGKFQAFVTSITTVTNGEMVLSGDYGVTWKWIFPTLPEYTIDFSDNLKYVLRPATTVGGGPLAGLIWIRKA